MANTVKTTMAAPLGEWLEYELDASYNREEKQITVPAGARFESGTPVKYDSGSGTYQRYVSGSVLSGDKVGILIAPLENNTASDAIMKGAILARGPAVIQASKILFDSSATASDKDSFMATLQQQYPLVYR